MENECPDELRPSFTRRDLLRGGAAVAAGGLLAPACAGKTPGAVAAKLDPNRVWVPGGLQVRGPRFYRDDKPFFVSGFNYWSALPLSREGNTAGWDQVRRDLDTMQAAGVNTLRIMGSSEGPDTEPLRIVPSLQPAQGQYDPAGVAGLLKLVKELEQRKLVAILVLNNFWHWSGGMAAYLAWAGAGPVPYPPPHPGGDWDRYQKHTATFYSNAKATAAFADFIKYLVPQLKASPAVIWELGNEPRGINNVRQFRPWIDQTAGLIRSLAPGQLVTTGSEGLTGSPVYSGTDPVKDHESANIDFVCCHLWPRNWDWVRNESLESGLPKVLERSKKYVNDHVAAATTLDKPLLLEEFGYPRDNGSFDPASTVTSRDKFYQEMYSMIASLKGSTPMAGIMPWAWAGDTVPARPGEFWKPGDPFIGDPPHEEQGWYSVYTKDTTYALIKGFAGSLVA